MSRFLVTGATGFIGSAILRRLRNDRHDVVDRRIELLGTSDAELATFVGESGASHCIHCAWYTNHADYLTHQINREWVFASLRLADAVAAAGARFIGLGTCLEYDVGRADHPCAEDRTPLRPKTLYGRCKLELLDALAQRALDFAWARVFFVYGPGDREGRLIPSMIECFSRGEPSGPTYGGLRRDYIRVNDLAGQILRIATSAVQGAINTGTGEAPTLSEIFAAGARAFGRPELARSNDETGGQPPLIQADLTRFRAAVGEPEARTIAEGLADLVA